MFIANNFSPNYNVSYKAIKHFWWTLLYLPERLHEIVKKWHSCLWGAAYGSDFLALASLEPVYQILAKGMKGKKDL